MRCSSCSREIPDAAKFCPHCGGSQVSIPIQKSTSARDLSKLFIFLIGIGITTIIIGLTLTLPRLIGGSSSTAEIEENYSSNTSSPAKSKDEKSERKLEGDLDTLTQSTAEESDQVPFQSTETLFSKANGLLIGSSNGVYLVDNDGSIITKVSDLSGFVFQSPDGKRIATVAGSIYLMNIDGSNVIEIPVDPYSWASTPALSYSKDGTEISFIVVEEVEQIHALVTIDSDSGEIIRTREISLEGEIALNEWSPDGEKLLLLNILDKEDYSWRAYLVDRDGGVTSLSEEPWDAFKGAAWSLDGTRLAIIVPPNLLDIINASSSSTIHSRQHSNGGLPAGWLPNNRQILFIKTEPDSQTLELSTENLIGDVVEIVTTNIPVEKFTIPILMAPDGSRLAVRTFVDRTGKLTLVDLETGDVVVSEVDDVGNFVWLTE